MTPRRSPYTSARRHGDGVVFECAGVLYELDGVGGRIYRLIDGQRSVSEIAAQVAAEFEERTEAVEPDVAELVAELRALAAVV